MPCLGGRGEGRGVICCHRILLFPDCLEEEDENSAVWMLRQAAGCSRPEAAGVGCGVRAGCSGSGCGVRVGCACSGSGYVVSGLAARAPAVVSGLAARAPAVVSGLAARAPAGDGLLKGRGSSVAGESVEHLIDEL